MVMNLPPTSDRVPGPAPARNLATQGPRGADSELSFRLSQRHFGPAMSLCFSLVVGFHGWLNLIVSEANATGGASGAISRPEGQRCAL